MKICDYIAKRVKREADHVFGVTGGCVVNLVDSFYKAGLNVVPMHHEQSAAIAADAYARLKGFGVCFGTSGPGSTNLITGTACSYYDSIPVLTLGGQVPRKYLNKNDRQTGFQETNGVELFKPITKLSRRMNHPADLEEAIILAKGGRPGPTFLEICDDFQRDDAVLTHRLVFSDDSSLNFESLRNRVLSARNPLVIVGAGAREMDLKLEVPFLYTWGIKDKFYNEEFCKGDFGITGSPNGNRMTKESDLIVMIGTRMDNHKVPDWDKFAPQAYKIALGLEFPHKVDEKIDCKLDFPLSLTGNNWGVRQENTANSDIYNWVDRICAVSKEGDVIIPDMGQTGCIVLQRWKPKKDQRLFNGMNHSPMGYALPGAIGAAFAGRKAIAIVGDGSFLMNLQDLQTIRDYNLPVQIYVVSNNGYGMIRQTQDDWASLCKGIACNFDVPVKKIAKAFNLDKKIKEVKFRDTKISPKWRFGTEL